MDWFNRHLELVISSLLSAIGGLITGALFIIKLKGQVQEIDIRTLRIEKDVHEIKKFKDDFIRTSIKVSEYDKDMDELKRGAISDRLELVQEFSRSINNVIDFMKEYIKRNDEEIKRLRDNYEDVTKEILTSLVTIQRSLIK